MPTRSNLGSPCFERRREALVLDQEIPVHTPVATAEIDAARWSPLELIEKF